MNIDAIDSLNRVHNKLRCLALFIMVAKPPLELDKDSQDGFACLLLDAIKDFCSALESLTEETRDTAEAAD